MPRPCEICKIELTKKQKRTCSRKCSRRLSSGFMGKKHSIEDLEKMSNARLKNPNRYWLGKKFTKEHIKKLVDSHIYKLGEDHFAWKGEEASYFSKHHWMEYHFGKPQFCEGCGVEEANAYHWANISGEYKRDRNDWLRLCQSCHFVFDEVGYKSWETRRERYGKSGRRIIL